MLLAAIAAAAWSQPIDVSPGDVESTAPLIQYVAEPALTSHEIDCAAWLAHDLELASMCQDEACLESMTVLAWWSYGQCLATPDDSADTEHGCPTCLVYTQCETCDRQLAIDLAWCAEFAPGNGERGTDCRLWCWQQWMRCSEHCVGPSISVPLQNAHD